MMAGIAMTSLLNTRGLQATVMACAARLPKSFMAENTVFLLLTAIIRNFYKFLMDRLDTKAFGLKKTSRIKAFVFRFISVPAKWIRTARHYQLNIYTDNISYKNPFAPADG